MTDRQHRILAVLMYVAAAICLLKVPSRASSFMTMNPFLIAWVLLDVLIAVLLVLGARVAWRRGEEKAKVSELE